jgi:hypothetical protein
MADVTFYRYYLPLLIHFTIFLSSGQPLVALVR